MVERHLLINKLYGMVLLLGCLTSCPAVMADATFESSLIKIKPGQTYSGQSELNLKGARNEYLSFQIVLNGPMQGITVSCGPLAGDSGSIGNENILCCGVSYMNITTPSNFEGGIGTWPDGLIPSVDPYFSEQRNSFPINVPEEENRLVWIDLFIPPDASAGDYAGEIVVESGGQEIQSLSYTVHVWNFTLPSTSSLPTAFGFDGWEVLRGHFGEEQMHEHYDEIVPLTRRYLDSALRHRITLSSFLKEDWDMYDEPVDWTAFDERWRDYLDGYDTVFGLQNAALTSVELTDCDGTDQERINYWQAFAQHFRQQGRLGVLFDYTFDEPYDAEDYAAIADRTALIRQADPELRTLVTTDIQEASQYDAQDDIDVWVPLINFIYGKPYDVCWDEEYEGYQRDEYDTLLQNGDELWWYQSCMSHGCAGSDPDDQCEAGYPSYMIDHSAVRNRIMSWMTYFYDIHGELYFAVNYADEAGDAWVDQFYFGGNGDGTLFYPGRPSQIGGTSHIPVESIRLKHIRDGLEDYEYFLLLEQVQGRAAVVERLQPIITNAYTYSENPELMASIIDEIGEALDTSMPYVGVRLSMPDDYFSPGEECGLNAVIFNDSEPLLNTPLFCLLDIYGQYWFWDDWTHELDYHLLNVPTGDTSLTIIDLFTWPDTGQDSLQGLAFLAALVDTSLTSIIGDYDILLFGYGP